MRHYLTRLIVETLLTLSVVVTGGPDLSDAFETVRQRIDEQLASHVRKQRVQGERS